MDKEIGFSPIKEAETKQGDIRRIARDVVRISNGQSDSTFKVLPGNKWGVYYSEGESSRSQTIKGLISGEISPENAHSKLTPEGLLYDIQDVFQHGSDQVIADINRQKTILNMKDVGEEVSFYSSLQGRHIEGNEAGKLYDLLSANRILQRMHNAYFSEGKKWVRDTLNNQHQEYMRQGWRGTRVEKVLRACSAEWMASHIGAIGQNDFQEAVSMLDENEVILFESVRNDYIDFTTTGNSEAFIRMTKLVATTYEEDLKNAEERDEEKRQELAKDLEEYVDQVGTPGGESDPAIPPEDSDEYHTSMPNSHPEAGEGERNDSFFIITPAGSSKKPMMGYYRGGAKSYWDPKRKVWSKKKQTTHYTTSITGSMRQKISGASRGGTTSLPIPGGYAVDGSSLEYEGIAPKILRDQNGCFYIESSGNCTYSVEFLKEHQRFGLEPIPEDLEKMYTGELSSATQDFIIKLAGSNTQMAISIVRYIRSRHWYPGGGDLNIAQALQHKLRVESAPEDYIRNLDKSEYLECYSASTLCIALLRDRGIPARLVTGHLIDSVLSGEAAINSTTGHAWVEYWNGQDWIRIDPTPNARSDENSNAGDQGQEVESGENADDGGIDMNDQNQSDDSKDFNSDLDESIADAQKTLEDAQKAIDQAEQAKNEVQEKISQAESMQELEDIKKDIEGNSDMFEDMKTELEDMIEAIEDSKKNDLEQQIQEMFEDGFIDEETQQSLERMLEEAESMDLDEIERRVARENKMYQEYLQIVEEVEPLVDYWYRYFAERLPTRDSMEYDDDFQTRTGSLDRRAIMKPRNLIFGTVKNPRTIKSTIEPKFLASMVVDASGSMSGEKMENVLRLQVFFSELFSRIGSEYGYIRSSICVFSDALRVVKKFDQEYDSPERYEFGDGSKETIKLRIMKQFRASGGTNTLQAIKRVAQDINEETYDFPDHASAVYYIGDGQDTHGNSSKVREFIQAKDSNEGFGDHMMWAIMLGSESDRHKLATMFGNDQTLVASNFDTLIQICMEKFDEDIEYYLEGKVES